MDWQEERDKFWTDFELYDDDNAPTSKQWCVVYVVELNRGTLRNLKTSMYNPFRIYLEVHDDGLVQLGDHTTWFGVKVGDMNHEQKSEIYEYLTEWEICEWQRVGPEDSELFATDKLTQ
jgi:hypothetical protein